MPYRKSYTEKTVYDLAVERINVIYDRYDRVSVAFSGGKDSTVCLQLTLDVARERGRLPLDVFFWDEEAIPPDTVDYVDRVSKWPDVTLRWFCMPIIHRNACSRKHPYWNPWAPEDRAKWCRPLPPQAITEVPGFKRCTIPDANCYIHPPEVHTAVITGMRADESLRRHRIVTTRSFDNYLSIDGTCSWVTQAKPIYDWTTKDVWTAPKRFGWDYNKAYDVMTAAGMSRHEQRCCPPYGEQPLQRLWQYAVCWPELWEKMCYRVPGAATAARYSRSPLYQFNARTAGPPPGKTWQEAIKDALAKWPDEQRGAIARRIQQEIAKHNEIYDHAPLPDNSREGLSWAFLYTLAVRGDLKRRAAVPYKSKT